MRIEKIAAVMFWVMVEEYCTVWQWTASKLTNGPRNPFEEISVNKLSLCFVIIST